MVRKLSKEEKSKLSLVQIYLMEEYDEEKTDREEMAKELNIYPTSIPYEIKEAKKKISQS